MIYPFCVCATYENNIFLVFTSFRRPNAKIASLLAMKVRCIKFWPDSSTSSLQRRRKGFEKKPQTVWGRISHSFVWSSCKKNLLLYPSNHRAQNNHISLICKVFFVNLNNRQKDVINLSLNVSSPASFIKFKVGQPLRDSKRILRKN